MARGDPGALRPAGGFTIGAGDASLPGHFPGRPVVPGVMLLDHAVALILGERAGERLAGLDDVKFLAPVLPEQPVAVAWAPAADRVVFSCSVAGRVVLRGRARLAPA